MTIPLTLDFQSLARVARDPLAGAKEEQSAAQAKLSSVVETQRRMVDTNLTKVEALLPLQSGPDLGRKLTELVGAVNEQAGAVQSLRSEEFERLLSSGMGRKEQPPLQTFNGRTGAPQDSEREQRIAQKLFDSIEYRAKELKKFKGDLTEENLRDINQMADEVKVLYDVLKHWLDGVRDSILAAARNMV